MQKEEFSCTCSTFIGSLIDECMSLKWAIQLRESASIIITPRKVMKVDLRECAIFCYPIFDEFVCVCVWGGVYVFFI